MTYRTDQDARVIRRLDAAISALIAAVIALDVVLGAALGFRVEWTTFGIPALATAAALTGAVVYGRWRPDERLATACMGTAQLVAFTAAGAPLSYIAASAGLPLQDDVFAAIDAALGFDWVWLFQVMDRWSALQPLFSVPYGSMLPQIAVMTLALGFFGRHLELRLFLLAFALAALSTVAASAVVPAVGPPLHYNIEALGLALKTATGTQHVAVFEGLRDGSIRTLVGLGTEGLICMPSLHAASAVLLMRAGLVLPVLRWPFVAINALMLFSTVIEGSHYLADVLAGVALAFAAERAARAIAKAAARDRVRATALA
ncbi:phosphatase PAP2 family protein [Chthonobacter albigriseus]|uniref:phosphatase PAP2 family protein n=1 Tax=Chthonobacter albigriseus TaxID=1683161 RepID=UPI0015EEF2B5|nr:phosphatase PAP2 family protein [Chthonobacter albigriseus]